MKSPLLLLLITLVSCHSTSKHTLKVAATSVPHSEMLKFIKPEMKAEGIDLEILEIDDYNLPNALLYEEEVDANFFQHRPFLEEQNKRYGSSLIALKAIHYEPLGLYSEKISSLDALEPCDVIAVPSDPSNENRALLFLESLSLISLKKGRDDYTIHSIEDNPLHLQFEEIDAPMLARTLSDVTLAVIPANFALQAHLSPLNDALALERSDLYANVVVVRKGDKNREELISLGGHLTSERMKAFLLEKYRGAVTLIP